MTQHVPLDFEDPVPEEFFDAVQEMLSGIAVNFRLTQVNPTTLKVSAGAGHDQVSLSIGGAYRYIAADVQVAHPGGAAGTYTVWATSIVNQALPAAGPAGGDHSFGLAITSGASPAGAGISRAVGRLVWNGSAITQITTLVGGGNLASSGDTIVGVEMAWAGSGDPSDSRFLLADGRLIDSATYPEFDALCGQAATGADKHRYNQGVSPGAGKVRIPDKRGRGSVGASNMGTAQGNATGNDRVQLAAGQSAGEVVHQLTGNEHGAHVHADGTLAAAAHAHQHLASAALRSGQIRVTSPQDGNMDWNGSHYDPLDVVGAIAAEIGAGNGDIQERWVVTSTSNGADVTGATGASTGFGTASVGHNNVAPVQADNWIVRVK